MKPHLRRVLPVTAAEAAAKIEVRPHNALGTVLAPETSGGAAPASTR